MSFEQEARYTRAERFTYDEIKLRILDGRLAPGTRLVIRRLAKELGVSAIPVILALRMLERDGLLVNIPGHGNCVRTWSREEIIDLHRIRAFHEALAARLCTERATEEDIKAIVSANEAFKRATEASDPEAHVDADLSFHVALVRGAHCPDLERMTNNGAVIECSMREFGISLNFPRKVVQEFKELHTPIAEAIVQRDPDAAEKAARQHVEESLTRNLDWIDKIAQAMEDDAERSLPKWLQPRATSTG
ncbi:MAG: GntR family transcriptional regulator [Armatimonadetes bacterium]|nr:GntR family transcriptional regulator [Armatimonadota bacterium]